MAFKLRTLLILLVGVIVGLLFSPVSLLLQFQEVELSARQFPSLCFRSNEEKAAANTKRNLTAPPLLTPDARISIPPPKYPHNPCKLSPDGNVSAPNDPAIRYHKLSDELAPRSLVYIGVISSSKYLPTRGVGIYRTWGKEISPHLHFYSAPPEDESLSYLPVISMPGINDTQYPPQTKVYRALKYMADHFIEKYDFFIRSDDDVYYRMEKLIALLEGINPAQDIYMGCPGFGRSDDVDRIKLEQHEHYCMGGPGVIFSRSALRKLAPHLERCLKSVVVSWNEDVEVGRCVSKVLQIQCTWAWEASMLFWTDYKRIIPTPELYTSEPVQQSLSLHPIKDPRLMYRVHQFMQELRLKDVMRRASAVQADVQQISQLVPRDMNRYSKRRWLWYDLGTNPKTRFEISVWEYFNSTRLFLSHEHMPIISLPAPLMAGSNTALEVLLDIMNAKEATNQPFEPPYQLLDGFTITDHSSGVQYHLHVSVHKKMQQEAVEYMASVFLPFQGAGMAVYCEAQPLLKRTIHIVICIAHTHDIKDFLQMYDTKCLRTEEHTHLHVVVFGANTKAQAGIDRLQQLYPTEGISTYDLPDTPFSFSHGYDYVARQLDDEELLLLFDHNFHFTSEFLDHCRMLAARGSQAFFPVAFSFFKPELVDQFVPHPPQTIISADTGFFLRYNYQIVALYKSDYILIGGFGASQTAHNDDVRFVDKVLESNVYALRGLEPYLRRNYRPRSCKGLEGNAHSICLNSRADAIGSKKILGSLLASHDLLDQL